MKRFALGICLGLVVVASMAQLNLVNVGSGVVGVLPRANGGTGSAGTAISLNNGTNAETITCSWVSNAGQCVTAANGGTARNFRVGSAANLILSANNGVDFFQVTGATGNFVNNGTGVISVGAAPATPLANSLFIPPTTFSALATPTDGTVIYCSDCTVTTAATCPGTQASCVCANSGTGAFARRVAGTWLCTP